MSTPLSAQQEHAEPEIPVHAPAAAAPVRAAYAVSIGIVLILLTALAIRSTEMVSGRYLSNGVPPVPAFTALLLLTGFSAVARRFAPRIALSRSEILLVYAMLTVATVLSGAYEIRAFLPHLVSLQYLGRANLAMEEYAKFLPPWYAPRDKQAVLDYFNGAHSQTVPWSVWIGPLFWWSLFLGAIFAGAFSLIFLVQRRWLQEERLTFPLLTIPLAVTSNDWSAFGDRSGRRTLFMLGFGAAALYNGINIAHLLYPPFPAPSFYISFTEFFPDRPLKPLGDVVAFFFLEAIGIGYFVPLDITFSIWFFYLLNRLIAVGGMAAGYDEPGFPFTQEQSAGGYIAMGLLLLWGLRRSFARSLRRAFAERRRDAESTRERWAWIGLTASTLFILGFCTVAGLSPWLALGFFAILGMFVLVVARIRAETGVPFGFVYPYGMPKEMLLNAVSFPGAMSIGGARSMVLLSSLAWLSRHHLPEEQAAYQIDSVKLATESRIPMRTMAIALCIAFGVGLVAAYWVHLSAYYAMGSNMAAGGSGSGEFRALVAQQEYQQMASRLGAPPVRSVSRLLAAGGGFCAVGLLTVFRAQFLRSAFNPLGFLIATAYGDSLNAWFPALIVWMCKSFILRAGGLPLYRRGIPFFLGLAMGHFFCAGILWPILSLFLASEATHAYPIYFGG